MREGSTVWSQAAGETRAVHSNARAGAGADDSDSRDTRITERIDCLTDTGFKIAVEPRTEFGDRPELRQHLVECFGGRRDAGGHYRSIGFRRGSIMSFDHPELAARAMNRSAL